MESLWTLMNAYQLIALMPLMRINFPPNAILLFKTLAFINGDLYVLQKAYSNSFGRVL